MSTRCTGACDRELNCHWCESADRDVALALLDIALILGTALLMVYLVLRAIP